jgi:hypothetical protein
MGHYSTIRKVRKRGDLHRPNNDQPVMLTPL